MRISAFECLLVNQLRHHQEYVLALAQCTYISQPPLLQHTNLQPTSREPPPSALLSAIPCLSPPQTNTTPAPGDFQKFDVDVGAFGCSGDVLTQSNQISFEPRGSPVSFCVDDLRLNR